MSFLKYEKNILQQTLNVFAKCFFRNLEDTSYGLNETWSVKY